jgi:ribonuclease Z
MPLPERRLTALLYRYGGRMVLIDCGEGTQVSIKLAGWGYKALEAILFTHYHADHVAGLPGLLLTLANSGKTDPLFLFGPPGLEEVVHGLTVIAPNLPYDLLLCKLPDHSPCRQRMGELFIQSMPADHRIPCLSYSLEMKRAGLFDTQRAQAQGIPVAFWNRLQKGETIWHEGKVFEPDMVLGEPRRGIKVTYCTDTRPTGQIALLARDSDLLVCEGIYGEDEKRDGAIEKKHMVFTEAAALARESEARELWLTHYSPSLKDPLEFVGGARAIFPNTLTGFDGMVKTLHFE